MKKTLLATGILAAMLSTSSIAATIYKDGGTEFSVNGRAEARFNLGQETDFEDLSRARISLEGKTDIADGWYAFGKYELEANNDAGDIESRYLFAGVGSQWGTFSYGKQDTAAVMLSDLTDTMETFGGNGDLLDAEFDSSDRVENNFAYVGTFNALTVGANYVVGEGTNSFNAKKSDKYTVGASYVFDFGLTFGAGYFAQEETDLANKADGYMVAAQYAISDFTFGAMYNAASQDSGAAGVEDTDYMGYEFSAQYDINKFSLVATYNYAEEDKNVTGVEATELAQAFAVEGVYKFNDNFRSYVGYEFDNTINDNDSVQAGIRYDF